MKNNFNKQRPHIFYGIIESLTVSKAHSALGVFMPLLFWLLQVKSGDKSGKVSLGNGLQKGVWELNSDEQWKLWSAREQLYPSNRRRQAGRKETAKCSEAQHWAYFRRWLEGEEGESSRAAVEQHMWGYASG